MEFLSIRHALFASFRHAAKFLRRLVEHEQRAFGDAEIGAVQLQFAALDRRARTNGNVIRFSSERNTAAFSIRTVKSCIVSWSRWLTCSPGLMNIAIQRPMKSPGDSGSILSMKARMPPHWACPSTTICSDVQDR